mmetsp:Transcript_18139/g.56645  ORF Transcript_18139/g.56645 Transcript_18139/m.56645 type:complete len:209 (-) Transcript_18139:561-1187(-)
MASCRARLAAGDSPLSGVICTLQDYLLVAANRLTAIARYARTLRICSCEAQKVRSIIITMRARTALAAAAFAAAVDALSSSSPTRWRPYLEPGAAPLKDSQCVVRFVNVPASALDASARPSADCFEIWRRGGDVVIVLSRPRGRANGSGADRGAAAGRNVDISRADRTRGAIELRRMVRADGLRAALDDAASPRVPDNAPPPFRRPSL